VSTAPRRRPSGRWEAWVSAGFDPQTGRRRQIHVYGRTRTEVLARVRDVEARRDAGAPARSPTVAEWMDRWLAGQAAHVRPKTMSGYRPDVKRIVDRLGPLRLDRLRPSDVEALWAGMVDAGASAGLLAHTRRTLSAALFAAVRDGLLAPPHAAQRARVPRPEPAEEIRPLTIAEARRVLAAAEHTRQPARWSVALALGLRQGETLGLRWEDVDLDTGTLTVRRQLQWRSWAHGCPPGPDGRPSCRGLGGRDPSNRQRPRPSGRCPQRQGGGPVLVEPTSRAAGAPSHVSQVG